MRKEIREFCGDCLLLILAIVIFAAMLAMAGCDSCRTGLPNFGSNTFRTPAGKEVFDLDRYTIRIADDASCVRWQVPYRNPTEFVMTLTFCPAFTIREMSGGKIEWEAKPEPITKTVQPGASDWLQGVFPLPEKYHGKKLYLISNDDCGVRRFSDSATGAYGTVKTATK